MNEKNKQKENIIDHRCKGGDKDVFFQIMAKCLWPVLAAQPGQNEIQPGQCP